MKHINGIDEKTANELKGIKPQYRELLAEIETLKTRLRNPVGAFAIEQAYEAGKQTQQYRELSTDEIFDIWDEHSDWDGRFVTTVDEFVRAILKKARGE